MINPLHSIEAIHRLNRFWTLELARPAFRRDWRYAAGPGGRQATVRARSIYDSVGRSSRSEDRQGSAEAGDSSHFVCAGRNAGVYRIPVRVDLWRGRGDRVFP